MLADGSIVQTDAEREPELLWALRGGGGNFGIVTQFSFRCHPVTTVLAGPVLYDMDDTAELLTWYRDFLPSLPDEVSGPIGTSIVNSSWAASPEASAR